MAVSLAELIITCLLVDWVFRKVKVPGLIGMLLVGIAFGPYVLGVVDENLLAVSADLRLIALIVILLRAGFELSKDTLSRVGLMALLLSFVPACFEIAVITLLGPYFLGLTTMESAILGAILGAVSPAVVVPLMIRFIEERRGAQKGIPTLVIGGLVDRRCIRNRCLQHLDWNLPRP
jgi:NhaP-type Na+/H+ or K+/H+ antiporter